MKTPQVNHLPTLSLVEPPTSGDQIVTVEVNGLPEGTRSQPGHHGPGYVTVEPGENGTEGR